MEVSEFGKLPISIGRKPQFREEMSSERLREFSTTPRIPFDERRNKVVNPNFDFERIDPEKISVGSDYEDFGVDSSDPRIRENRSNIAAR